MPTDFEEPQVSRRAARDPHYACFWVVFPARPATAGHSSLFQPVESLLEVSNQVFDILFGFRIAPHPLPATFEEMPPKTLSYHVGVIVCRFVQQDAGKWCVILCKVVSSRFSVALGVEKMGLRQP